MTHYKNIAKDIDTFLSEKKNDLGRTAVLKVKTDDVKWELNTKLTDTGVTSHLEVGHTFNTETFELKTFTNKTPIFRLISKRFADKVGRGTFVFQDPEIKFKYSGSHPKASLMAEEIYNYQTQAYSVEPKLTYTGLDKCVFGVSAKFVGSRDEQKPSFEVKDFNAALQYDRNEDQTFAITTEKKATVINSFARFRVRDVYTGYANVSFVRPAPAPADDKAAADAPPPTEPFHPISFQVGLRRKLCPNSSVFGIYRSNNTASLQYQNKFSDLNLKTRVGANFVLGKRPLSAQMMYKVVYG